MELGMSTAPFAGTWSDVLARLRHSLGDSVCARWFTRVAPIGELRRVQASSREAPIVIACPARMTLDHVRTCYGGALEQAISETLGTACALEWVVDPGAASTAALAYAEATRDSAAASGPDAPTISEEWSARPLSSPGGLPMASGGATAVEVARVGEERRVAPGGGHPIGASQVSPIGITSEAPTSFCPVAPVHASACVRNVAPKSTGADARRREPESQDFARVDLDEVVLFERNEWLCSVLARILEGPGAAFNPFFVHGDIGSGKSHLLRAIGTAYHWAGRCRPRRSQGPAGTESDSISKPSDGSAALAGSDPLVSPVWPGELSIPSNLRVRFVSAERFLQHYVARTQDRSLGEFQRHYRNVDVLIVEDVHHLEAAKGTRGELVRTIDSLVAAGKQVILSANVEPAELPGFDAAERSRLGAGLVARLSRPSFGARVAILRERTRAAGKVLSGAVIERLARSATDNLHDLIGKHNLVLAHAGFTRDPVDVAFVDAVLEDHRRDRRRVLGLDRVLALVAESTSLRRDDLVGRGRKRSVSDARNLAFWLAREYTNRSLREIGRFFGARSHSTVLSGCERVEEDRSRTGTLAHELLDVLRKRIEEF
jgi:chromosomal replication initiator protein